MPLAFTSLFEDHPLKLLGQIFNFEVQGSQSVRLRVKLPSGGLQMTAMHFSIPLINNPTLSVESVLRISRVTEVLNHSGEREVMADVDWLFEQDPTESDMLHPALALVASEAICPSCRTTFSSRPVIKNSHSIHMDCPTCRNEISITVRPSRKKGNPVSHLVDDYRDRTEQVRSMIRKWISPTKLREHKFKSYFPLPISFDKSSCSFEITGAAISSEVVLTEIVNFCFSQLIQTENSIHNQNPEACLETVEEPTFKKITSEPIHSENHLVTKPRNKSLKYVTVIGILCLSIFGILSLTVRDPQNPTVISEIPILIPEVKTTEQVTAALEPNPPPSEIQIPILEEKTPPKIENAPLLPTKKNRKNIIKNEVDKAYSQARLHLELRQFDAAIASLKKVLEKNPSFKVAYRDLGIAYFLNKREDEAALAFKHFISAYPQSSERKDIELFLKNYEEKRAAGGGAGELLLDEKWSSLTPQESRQESQ